MANKVKEHIEFHYLLTEIRVCALILLGWNIFYKKYLEISKTNLSLIT